jgi:hypothetical protein
MVERLRKSLIQEPAMKPEVTDRAAKFVGSVTGFSTAMKRNRTPSRAACLDAYAFISGHGVSFRS